MVCSMIPETEDKAMYLDTSLRREPGNTNVTYNNIDSKNIEKNEYKEEAANGLLEKPMTNGQAKIIPDEGMLIIRDDALKCNDCSNIKTLTFYPKIKKAPVLCWYSTDKKLSPWVITLWAATFLFFLTGTVVFFFTDFFNSAMLSKMIIANNTQAYDLWREPPVHPIMKVHVFNYTNALRVMEGKESKLRVQDIGPYVYEETVEKVNIQFHPNGTVTYQSKRSFKMIPERSVGAQYDKVVVPNLPMLSAISMVKESYFVAKMGLSTLFTTLKAKPFRELPIHRYLWGYEDELVNLAKSFIKLAPDMPSFEKFGILTTFNGTSRDVITVNTGEKDMNKFAIIDRYNGFEKLPHWGTDECNKVEATDGSMFPPSMVDGKQKLYIYSQQACRRLPFEYIKDVDVLNGIKAKRYSVPDNVFASPDINPENQCYCHMDSATCPPNGLFNSTPCAYGAPALASFPHFYLGDQSVIDAIDGLEPTADKHAMHLDVHPTLGFPLAAVQRIQLNMQLRKSQGISGSGLDNIPNNIILPIVWLEFTVDELPPLIKSIVYHGTYSANLIRIILSCIFPIGLLICGLIFACVLRNRLIQRKVENQIHLTVME